MPKGATSANSTNSGRRPLLRFGLVTSVILLVAVLLGGTILVLPLPGSLTPSVGVRAPLHADTTSAPSILSFNATPNPTEVGVRSELTVTLLGNLTTGDSFSYLGLPPGCSSLDASNLTCTPSTAGTYAVTVSVSSLLGQAQKSLNWTVRAGLRATFNATSAASPLAVSFQGTVQGGFSLQRIAWNFGDGGTSNGSLSVTHTYASAGTYRVTLRVIDVLAASASATDDLSVSPSVGTLVAVAAETGTSGPSPLTVTFHGSASGGTGPYTFDWTFGDGAAASGSTPTHEYVAQGEFDVVLTVTDAISVSASTSLVVVVLAPSGTFAATISANVTAGAAPLAVSFQSAARGGTSPYTFVLTFGDGTAAVHGNLSSHTYTTPGVFEATVSVTDATGASTTAHVTLVVGSS